PQKTVEAPKKASDDAAARRLLDELDKAIAAGRYNVAQGLGAQLGKLRIEDPELNIRRVESVERARTAGLVAQAQMALDTGDREHALDLAKQVLARDFQNEAARAILEKARGETAEAPVVEESHAASGGRKGRRRAGTLSVRATPRATVYVDDLPVGQTPLASLRLTPGTHRIEARAEGYETLERTVKVRAGKKRSISLTLKAAAPEPPASSAVVAEAHPPSAPASTGPGPSAATEPGAGPEAVPASKTEAPSSPGPVAAAQPPPAPAQPAPKTEAAPPEAAPAPKATPKKAGPGKPRLPEVYTLHNRKDIPRVFGIIEKEIVVRGHVPAGRARNVTAPLAKRLYADFSPGTTIDVYPRGMYWMAVDLFGAGKSPRQVASALESAHRQGRLRGYRPKSR
ncbi:MAG: PEGA domain-containing protein, partial [Deltaproteobacteria bacterium]